MSYKEQMDTAYNQAVIPLDNFSQRTNTISGMLNYMKVFGPAVTDLASKVNEIYKDVQINTPELKSEAHDYGVSLHNKLMSTYKPQKH